MGSVRHGFTVVNTLLKIVEERRPLMVFGSIGLGLFIVGIALGFRVVDAWNATQEFAIGTSLVMLLMMMMGLLSVFTRIMLHAISKVQRKMQK
jgi:hypothetical protein